MISYAQAQVGDVVAIQKMLRVVWQDTYSSFHSAQDLEKITSVFHSQEALRSQVSDPQTFFQLAKDETGEIAGVVTARQTGDTVHIGRLYVHPDFQGRGIGSTLLKNALTHFALVKKAEVEVETKNNIGCSYYLSQGFKTVEQKKDTETIPGVEFNLKVMRKDL